VITALLVRADVASSVYEATRTGEPVPAVCPRLGLVTQLMLAVTIGTLTSSLILVGSMGVRPDLPAALSSPYVQTKFAFALLLSLTAFYAVMVGAQPDARLWQLAPPIAAAPMLLLIGVAFELASTPAADWARAIMGTHPKLCIAIVPSLAIAPWSRQSTS
jgi:hypothetical protein